MKKDNTITIGMDIGDKYSQICVLDNKGEVVEETRITTTKRGLSKFFSKRSRCRVVLEVGTHSPWISRYLADLGHEPLVANARQVALIYQNHGKDDRTDAELLARLARVDTKLLAPIKHRKEDTQVALAAVRSRAILVKNRTNLINHVRGVVKSIGERLSGSSTDNFYKYAGNIPECLQSSLMPVMKCIEELTVQIKHLEKEITRLANEEYPETKSLSQVPGVGPITSLMFILILEDPHRFAKSRQVGPYLGLSPRRRQSSNSDPQLRISKAGDSDLRRLLVVCAHYIMGRYGPDSDLRRWGTKLAQRGGKNAKRRAIVAVARRLSVILHTLWRTGEVYEPLRQSINSTAA